MKNVLPQSDEIVGSAGVQAALDRMAAEIEVRLKGQNPLVVTVMNGGLIFAGQLLPRLGFALELSYVHVRRYGRDTAGGELVWIAGPHEPVTERIVLLLDDILDEGRTLATIKARLLEQGATEVLIAAFALKERGVPAAIEADFIGVRVPNRFVFGFGMDVAGAWRNLSSIRALRDAPA
ncbi:MAG: hypoxanthine-guanine phosphoribosyltransferase [Steroidobacteraceae bacterium]